MLLQEPEKLEVEKSGGKNKKERHPNAHRNPPEMFKDELINMVGKLQDKVGDQNILIKEQKKRLKHGGDDGEGGKTYKQLYESQSGEFQEMKEERDRVTGVNEKLQEEIQTLKTAAAKAENEKQLFQKEFEGVQAMLKLFKDDNKELKCFVYSRPQNHSTYGATGSMSAHVARGPSPNENTAYNFISPT